MEVLHDRGPATPAGVDRWTSGSGYLVGRRMVLTVAHNVDYRCDFGDDEQLLARTIEGRVLAARVELVCDEPSQVDLALLEISDPQFGEYLTPATFARIDRDNPAPVTGCWAVGFPRFGEAGPVLPEGSGKETWQVSGDILPGTKRRAGLLSLQVTSAPQPLSASLAGSPWEGMSGAVVFAPDADAGELAVGVIAMHHRPEGESALTVVPITALAGLPAAEDWWHLLGVTDPGTLPVHPPRSVSGQLRTLAGLVELPLIDGRLPQVAGLDPYSLGTTPSAYGNAETHGQRDAYVPRAIDESLAAALRSGRLVVLVGPSKSGKTRTAFEVLRGHRAWRSALLAAPVPRSLDQLAGHPALGGADPLVIWLDDLQRFLPPHGELSQAVISRLVGRPGPTVLVATLRSEQRELLRGREGELTREVRLVLDNATSIELASTRDDPAEQARAAAAYPQAASGTEGLAEMLAGAPELLRRYHDAATADPPLHTLVQTCVDWARCGLARPTPELDLLALARDALWEERPYLDLSDGEMDEALRRARTPITGGQVALLGTSPLAGQSRGYEAFDYLVAADDGQDGGSSRPVTQTTWQRFLDRATDEDASGIAFSAWQRDNLPVAVEAGRRAAEAGDTDAQNLLGLVLATGLDPPEMAEARTWLTRAAEAGNTEAQNTLGILLGVILDPPEMAEARTWLTRAAEAGNTGAQRNLGAMLATELDPPELAEARTWWTRAAEAGNTDAQRSLGWLLERLDPPELAEARTWYTKAAEAGNTDAQNSLGMLLATGLDPPELAEARTWLTRAAEAGNTDAQYSLGWMLANLLDPPEVAEARTWWTKAAEAGHAGAREALERLGNG